MITPTKPSYQPWNEEEFSGDLIVSTMSPIQRWMYRTLLQKAFFYTTRPDLPTNENVLWKLAGCESRKQWDDNREMILSMFTLEDTEDSQVYFQKRLRQDWDRIVGKKESLSYNGSRGAQARWDETSKSVGKGLPYRRMIPEACRKILGIRTEREEYYKKDLKELADTYGGTEVVEAFEAWAKSLNETPKNPVRSFIKIADGFLTNKIKPDSPVLDSLCVSLYHIGDQAFTGRYRSILNSLLGEFSFQEIEKAYKAFVSNKNDYEMKFAVKDFCEGACKTIIIATKDKAKKDEDQKKIITEMTEEAQRNVATQLTALEEEVENSL